MHGTYGTWKEAEFKVEFGFLSPKNLQKLILLVAKLQYANEHGQPVTIQTNFCSMKMLHKSLTATRWNKHLQVQIELFPSLPDNLTLMIYLAKCPPITLQHILDLLIKQFRNIQDVQACLVPKLQLAWWLANHSTWILNAKNLGSLAPLVRYFQCHVGVVLLHQ